MDKKLLVSVFTISIVCILILYMDNYAPEHVLIISKSKNYCAGSFIDPFPNNKDIESETLAPHFKKDRFKNILLWNSFWYDKSWLFKYAHLQISHSICNSCFKEFGWRRLEILYYISVPAMSRAKVHNN